MHAFKAAAMLGSLVLTMGVFRSMSWATEVNSMPSADGRLEEIVVTAQKREINIQDSPLSIVAVSGATLAKDRIFTLEDLSHSLVGVSFSMESPLQSEINIRGVVNTQLSSATADQSVSTFVDDVYVSRTGALNGNFYDLERIEVLRGPQGVLLGKNVAGGAISVISAAPSFESSGRITVTGGNYGLQQTTGYLTGGITDELAGRIAFQTIDHNGYARDLDHNTDLENLDSKQLRAMLSYRPRESDLRVDLSIDYAKDRSNGSLNTAIPDPVLTGPRPWSTARSEIAALLNNLTVREGFETWPTYAGDVAPTPTGVEHENWSTILKIEKDVARDVTLTSISGYRHGNSSEVEDLTGIGPDNVYGVVTPLMYSYLYNSSEQVNQASEEIRLTSKYPDSRFDWLVGAYYLHNRVDQFNRLWGESPFEPGGPVPAFLQVLGVLTGQDDFEDNGLSVDEAVFGQVGFEVVPTLKIDLGVRYTHDKKSGVQSGVAVATGDRYSATDTAILTPLGVPSFSTAYGDAWSEATPQGTLTWKPIADLMTYLTISKGYKGGGFENDAANAVVARTPYNPETVTNYEVGYKYEFFDHKVRWNSSLFYMNYRDLQVQQISESCLCNIINNASSAKIKGIESELQVAPVHWMSVFLNGSGLSAKYDQFVDTNGHVDTGNFLQRTPRYQVSIGGEITSSIFSWADALQTRLTFKEQGHEYWAPDNLESEKSYGLLDGRVTLHRPGSAWSVSAFAKNITNQLYRTNVSEFFGDQVSTFGQPRTYGAEISLSF